MVPETEIAGVARIRTLARTGHTCRRPQWRPWRACAAYRSGTGEERDLDDDGVAPEPGAST